MTQHRFGNVVVVDERGPVAVPPTTAFDRVESPGRISPERAIGSLFAFALRQALKPDEWETMRALNAIERNPNICHSHDFVDANEFMAAAFAAVMGREIDLRSDADSAMWSRAWAAAAPAIRPRRVEGVAS